VPTQQPEPIDAPSPDHDDLLCLPCGPESLVRASCRVPERMARTDRSPATGTEYCRVEVVILV